MNTLVFYYIDHVVLALSFVFTFVHTFRMLGRAKLPLRKGAAFFAIFGPTAITCFLGFGHLAEISFHAIEKAIAGTFVYDFRFYSLMLMGMVLLTLGAYMQQQIGHWFAGVPGSRQQAVRTALVIIAVSAPTIFFTPIGSMPSMACAISLLAFPFAVKKTSVTLQSVNA